MRELEIAARSLNVQLLPSLRRRHLRAEAVAGIAATRKMVATSLATRRGNYSLCHGLAGNAEVLLHAEEFLGSGWAEDRLLAVRVAEDGMERFAGPDRSWPCGVHEGTPPTSWSAWPASATSTFGCATQRSPRPSCYGLSPSRP